MALTGLFLCSFLIAHLSGNLQLLITGDEGYAFNRYANFMVNNPVIKILGILTYLSILLHAIKGLHLAYKNKQARKNSYKKYNGSANSSWMSRSMGVLGIVILAFIVLHMRQFWYEYKWGKPENHEYIVFTSPDKTQAFGMKKVNESMQNMDTTLLHEFIDYSGMQPGPKAGVTFERESYKDLYTIVAKTYQDPLYVAIYLVSMFAIGFHLLHGFKSGFQTLGLNHPKYNGLINAFGILMGVIVPALFALIPLVMFIR